MTFSTSYKLEGLPEILGNLVHIFQPSSVVELGVQQGASAITIARNLYDPMDHVDAYDLFEPKYSLPPYGETHADMDLAQKNIDEAGLTNRITLHQANAFDVYKLHKNVDMLHVDLCNHLDNVGQVMEQWVLKVNKLIILEGGVTNHWQKQYGFKSFLPILDAKFIWEHWTYAVIGNYSSFAMTVMTRRQNDPVV